MNKKLLFVVIPVMLLLIASLAIFLLGITAKRVSAEPGFTPISLIIPREGADVNKNAALSIVTERLSGVCCTGPGKVTVIIETTGPDAEVIARGSVNVNLVE